MIVVRLWGGLGNQLFQYATGYALANRLETELCIDTSWFAKQSLRQPVIKKFNIKYDTDVVPYEIANQVVTLQKKIINKLIRMPFINDFNLADNYIYIKEKHRNKIDREKVLNIKNKNIYLDGYWQHEEYFNSVRFSLLKILDTDEVSEKYLELKSFIKSCDSVSVHIRRADYLSLKTRFFTGLKPLEASYYKNIYEILKREDYTYFVFSDDIEWVKHNIPMLKNAIFVERSYGLKDYEELLLMSKCKHNIIANSTFSWWAAWLNQNPDKIVFAPKDWYVDRDLIPHNWVKK